jgi:hypothetical protein
MSCSKIYLLPFDHQDQSPSSINHLNNNPPPLPGSLASWQLLHSIDELLAKMQGLKPLKQNTKDRTESQSQVFREKEKEKRMKKQKEQQKRAEQKKLERGENKNAAF